jgi:hypothetical protein
MTAERTSVSAVVIEQTTAAALVRCGAGPENAAPVARAIARRGGRQSGLRPLLSADFLRAFALRQG